MDTHLEPVDVVVIGGSAAGLSAALFSARRGLNTVVVTKNIGGQLATTTDVPNYPGVDKVTGPELTATMQAQASAAGAKISLDEVLEIKTPAHTEGLFTVTTKSNSIATKTVILALGKTPRSLNLPGEHELIGKGVYYSTEDLAKYAGQEIAVVGGGGSAFVAAKKASTVGRVVHLIHRTDTYRAEEAAINELKQTQNIVWHPWCEVTAVNGSTQLEKITLTNSQTNEKTELPVSALFIEIGFEVKPDLFTNIVTTNQLRQIITSPRGETSVPGLFAAGDVTDRPFNQAIISAGEGATAALAAYTYITKKPAGADWGTK